jgi:Fe-S oxidoreductase
MLPEFAEVAGGHDFRRGAPARQRHRVKRKLEYLPAEFGGSFCTGCGRCGTQCTVGIDIFDIASDVLGGGGRP